MNGNNIELIPGPPPATRDTSQAGRVIHITDADDNWAEVELFRWQYGELPQVGDNRSLDISAGLEGMATAIQEGCRAGLMSKMPTPFNVCEVLNFCARRLRNKKQ